MLTREWMRGLGAYFFIVFCIAMAVGGNYVDNPTGFEEASKLPFKPAGWWVLGIGLAIPVCLALLVWLFINNPIAPRVQAKKPTKLLVGGLKQPPPSLARPTVGGDSRPVSDDQDADQR